jgi:hypothetical protein
MIFNRAEIRDPYDEGIFYIGIQNVGTRTAYDYHLVIITIEISTATKLAMFMVDGGNPVRRQSGISAEPRLDMSKFLDAIALCTSYQDEDGKRFEEQMFVNFPTMQRGLKKDKGGGGLYLAASVSPDERRKLDKMEVCKN